jgi:hypothetical protein
MVMLASRPLCFYNAKLDWLAGWVASEGQTSPAAGEVIKVRTTLLYLLLPLMCVCIYIGTTESQSPLPFPLHILEQSMASCSVSLLVITMLLLMLPPSPACSSLSCKLAFTSMALLSYQEMAPQTPTASCCEALLYSIDIWPIHEPEKGLCCLCLYMVSRNTTFDLPTSYVS